MQTDRQLNVEELILQLLRPENEVERAIINAPEFKKGLLWGKPRFGHPEGQVIYHIREVLDNVDKMVLSPKMRNQLRLITLTHDTFKYKEDLSAPRDWSKHHAVYARQFLERFTNDISVLKVVELHDEAFYSWRMIHRYEDKVGGERRLNVLLNKLKEDKRLYFLFFLCDTQTGDKMQEPLHWFTSVIEG